MSAPLPPPAAYVGVAAPPQRHTSGLAIASLVLGILNVWFVGSVLAIIFGVKARHEIDASNGWVTGKGMATAGMILGILWLCVGALIVVAVALS